MHNKVYSYCFTLPVMSAGPGGMGLLHSHVGTLSAGLALKIRHHKSMILAEVMVGGLLMYYKWAFDRLL